MKLVTGPRLALKKKKGVCIVLCCATKAYRYKQKNGVVRRFHFCPKHKRQHEKEINPVVYWYGIFKQNARRRKIECTITIEDFKSFCEHNNYIERKGKLGGKLTIDRIRSDMGYVPGNIQAKEHNDNCRKHHVDKKLREKYGTDFNVPDDIEDNIYQSDEFDLPF